MRLQEIKNCFHVELDTLYGKEEVSSFFYLLIEEYLEQKRFVLTVQPDFELTKEKERAFFDALNRLKLHEPIQYIFGKTYFMDMEFKVDENVLIPRPETEELVRWILDEKQRSTFSRNEKLRILDIGTGSGCIAISLAKNIPGSEVHAVDVSSDALMIAKENAKANKVDINFVHEDIFELKWEHTFDLIVSNPPYVRNMEKGDMQKNVLSFEPEGALYVPDDNALKFYEVISKFANTHLASDGMLFFEINQYLAKETEQLLIAHNFSEIELRKDMYGNDRMLKAKPTN